MSKPVSRKSRFLHFYWASGTDRGAKVSKKTAFTPLLFLMLVALPLSAGNIRRAARPIAGEYIVLVNERAPADINALSESLAREFGGSVIVTMAYGKKGFGVRLRDDQAERLSEHPMVAHVEENGLLDYSYSVETMAADNTQWHLDRIDQRGAVGTTKLYGYTTTGSNVRAYVIDSGIQKSHQEFDNDGIEATQGSRVDPGANYTAYTILPPEERDYYPPDNPCGGYTSNYDAGHGTAVASVLGGKNQGVARQVTLVPVKVGTCGDPAKISSLAVTWGLSWVIQDMSTRDSNTVKAVVNMSVFEGNPNATCAGVNCMSAIENNIQDVIASGIPVVVSANNQNSGACATSPARLGYGNFLSPTAATLPGTVTTTSGSDEIGGSGTEFLRYLDIGDIVTIAGTSFTVRAVWDDVTIGVTQAPTFSTTTTLTVTSPWRRAGHRTITVGGTTISDVRWSETGIGSNYGRCVDIYAPAANMKVAHPSSFNGYRLLANSGTSFAAPIVTGILARLRQAYPSKSPAELWSYLSSTATPLPNDLDPSAKVTNNKLAYISVYD